MRVFRLCKERYSRRVLSGDGGLQADGRWHTLGHPIVYCASAESLAVLELRVHIGNFAPRDPYVMHAVDVPDALLEILAPNLVPPGWDAVPHSRVSQALGDAWLVQRRSVALRVPSIHSTTEFNVLVNPGHDGISSIKLRESWAYRFDSRLFTDT